MSSNKTGSKDLMECCGGSHSKRSLMFGISVLVVGLMLQNPYNIADTLVIIGSILIIRNILAIVFRKE